MLLYHLLSHSSSAPLSPSFVLLRLRLSLHLLLLLPLLMPLPLPLLRILLRIRSLALFLTQCGVVQVFDSESMKETST